MRVLIVRMSAMGDIIHALPAVSALRRLWADALIGWAVEERWAPLLTARTGGMLQQPYRGPEQPLVDVIHLVSLKKWKSAPLSKATLRGIRDARREFRVQHYEVAIDLQGAIRSALLAKLSGVERLIGEDQPREHPARWWFSQKIKTYGKHVVEQAHEVVSGLVGERLPVTAPEFPRDLQAERWAEACVGKSTYAILNPGAGWGAKRWPVERYGALSARLRKNGIEPLINVGPGEAHLGAAVLEHSQGSARVVACSILQLIALTRQATLFIGGDTGPMHLASAMQVPVVAIFGPTDPARNGPFGSPHVILRHPESKRDHSRRSEPEEGILTISVDEVVESAWKLLAGNA